MLHAEGRRIPDELFRHIAPYLKKVELGQFRRANRTLNQAGFKATTHLKLTHPDDLRALIAAHTDAQGRIDGEHIKKITLSHADVTDADLALLKRFTSLDAVDFTCCYQITAAGIAVLPPGLEEVNFALCEITDAGVAVLKRTTVKVVDFTGCNAITDDGIAALPPGLEKVNFTGCHRVTDAGIANLPRTVKVVNFTGCPHISATMIESLRQRGVRVISAQSPPVAVFRALNVALQRAAIRPE